MIGQFSLSELIGKVTSNALYDVMKALWSTTGNKQNALEDFTNYAFTPAIWRLLQPTTKLELAELEFIQCDSHLDKGTHVKMSDDGTHWHKGVLLGVCNWNDSFQPYEVIHKELFTIGFWNYIQEDTDEKNN